MLYASKVVYDIYNKLYGYNLVDSLTGTTFLCSLSELKRIMSNGLQIVNLIYNADEITLKAWPHMILTQNPNFTFGDQAANWILFNYNTGIFRMFDCETSKLHSISTYRFKVIHDLDDIANCGRIKSYKDLKNKAIDAVEINTQDSFVSNINKKYTEFISKLKLLGFDNTFEYNILNTDVILTNYTGSSKDIILPNFITAIAEAAFRERGIDSIQLNDGLKVIGEKAFYKNNLCKVEVPETAEMIGYQAFEYNTFPSLYIESIILGVDWFKLGSPKTFIAL